MTRTKLCTPLNQDHRLFCSKIPVLVLAPSTGKPPPPSRKASIVLRTRGHTEPPRRLSSFSLGNPSGRHLGWFQHPPVIDCRRAHVKISGESGLRGSKLIRRRNFETLLRNVKYITPRQERPGKGVGEKNHLCRGRELCGSPHFGCV